MIEKTDLLRFLLIGYTDYIYVQNYCDMTNVIHYNIDTK